MKHNALADWPEPLVVTASPVFRDVVVPSSPVVAFGGGFARHRDSRRKTIGLALSILIHVAAAVILLIRWQHHDLVVTPPPAPLVLQMLPLAAPPEPVEELPPGPEQVEHDKPKPDPAPPPPELVIPNPSAATPPPAAKPAETSDPGPPVAQTSAPKSVPAPPAPRVSNDARESWQARLLAHLEKYRRYPGNARRQQGVVHVRFRMSREGKLLSLFVQQSSGVDALDKAALETLRRAQPLPRIPDDMPAEIELAVPVEFFLTKR